jgi:hypothetical protein
MARKNGSIVLPSSISAKVVTNLLIFNIIVISPGEEICLEGDNEDNVLMYQNEFIHVFVCNEHEMFSLFNMYTILCSMMMSNLFIYFSVCCLG